MNPPVDAPASVRALSDPDSMGSTVLEDRLAPREQSARDFVFGPRQPYRTGNVLSPFDRTLVAPEDRRTLD